MKSISDSDFSLILEKLPVALRLARQAAPHCDTRTANAIRMLALMAAKWQKKASRKATTITTS